MVSQGWRRPLLLVFGVTVGCDYGTFLTESGAFGLEPGLVTVPLQEPVVLEDSRFCPSVEFGYPAGEGVTELFLHSEDCFDIVGRSTARGDDGCFDLDAPGEEVFDISQRAQCIYGHEYPDDVLRVDVVPRDRVTAGVHPELEAYEPLFTDAEGAALSARNRHPLGDPLRVVEGQPFLPAVRIVDDEGRSVAYDDERYPPVYTLRDGDYERREGELAEEYRLDPGTIIDVSLEHETEPLPAGRLVAVPSSNVASLELQVGYGSSNGSSTFVRAVTRDLEGNLIYSAPVEWSSSGTEVGFIPMLPDYRQVSDDCLPPPAVPTERVVTLTAALGELRDSTEVRWTALPADPDDSPFERGEFCPETQPEADEDAVAARGCGCRSSRPSGMWWMLLLVGVRRR